MVADAIEEHGNRWVIMADPEGNEFVCPERNVVAM